MLFVSYHFKTKNSYGFGNASVNAEGIFSPDDLNQVASLLIASEKSYENVIILNWRKYDPAP